MPYIDQIRRIIEHQSFAKNEGELNFEIMTLVLDYINNNKLSYATLNSVIGTLECVKQELYRRLVGPYENGKIIEKGDLYQLNATINRYLHEQKRRNIDKS